MYTLKINNIKCLQLKENVRIDYYNLKGLITTISFTDIGGRVVYLNSAGSENSSFVLDMPGLPEGVYVITVSNEMGLAQGKVVLH